MKNGDISNKVEPIVAFSLGCLFKIEYKQKAARWVNLLPHWLTLFDRYIARAVIDVKPDSQAIGFVKDCLKKEIPLACFDVIPAQQRSVFERALKRYFPLIKQHLYADVHDLSAALQIEGVGYYYSDNQDVVTKFRYSLYGVKVFFFTDWFNL